MFFNHLKITALAVSLSAGLTMYAQVPVGEPCGYQYEVDKIMKKNPDFIAWQNAWYKEAHQEYQELQSTKRRIVADTVYYEIPVVFHVIYNTPAQNILDLYILSQMDELNLDFRKMNADTSRIRQIFRPLAADVRIQFKLATKDPNGNPTNGINRVFTTTSTFATNQNGNYNENMKSTANGGQDAWNPSKYLNIWICNLEFPNPISIVYGFATPPTGAPNWGAFGNATRDTTDGTTGAVFHYKIVGKNNPLAPAKYKEGNTATHEIGHYLGLRHVWGDASLASQGCSVDDGIFDTPNAKDKNYTCNNVNFNSCTDATNDKPDMYENYMDYALDGCCGMFTKEQAFMMRYVLNRFRTGLPKRNITYDTLNDFPNTIVSIYPNPSNNNPNITVLVNNNDDALKYNLTVYDNNGKEVIRKKLKANVKDYLRIEAYAPSVYYLIITNEDGKKIRKEKLIIQP